MKDAFKTKAREAATEFSTETAMRLIKPTMLRQPALARVFNQLPLRTRGSATVRIGTFSDSVYIGLMLSNLDSFKDSRLVNVLSKFDDWQAQTSDWTGSDAPSRDYQFTHKFTWEHDERAIAYKKLIKENAAIPQTFSIIVSISAWVKEDSATCRIVTKEREETIKKVDRFIVCD